MKRILVVDDDMMITGLLSEYLRKSSYEVRTACNGREAVEKVAEQTPDLILLDIEMPEKDGISALKEIRQKYGSANLPIIILSAEDDKKMWAGAMDSGANDFIQKPYDKIEILARVKTNLKVGELTNKLAVKTKELITEKMPVVNMQKRIIPQKLRADRFEIDCLLNSSKKFISSFYDVFETDTSTAFIIGHVPQDTILAPVVMSSAKVLISDFFRQQQSPLECISRTSTLIWDIFANACTPLSLVLAVCEKAGEELAIISAGSNRVYICSADGIQRIESTGPPLGKTRDASWSVSTAPFKQSDTLFLTTENLYSLRNPDGKALDETRLSDVLQHDRIPENQIQNLCQTLESVFGPGSQNHLTMMSARRT